MKKRRFFCVYFFAHTHSSPAVQAKSWKKEKSYPKSNAMIIRETVMLCFSLPPTLLKKNGRFCMLWTLPLEAIFQSSYSVQRLKNTTLFSLDQTIRRMVPGSMSSNP